MQWVNIYTKTCQPKNLFDVTNKIKKLKGIYKVNLFEKEHHVQSCYSFNIKICSNFNTDTKIQSFLHVRYNGCFQQQGKRTACSHTCLMIDISGFDVQTWVPQVLQRESDQKTIAITIIYNYLYSFTQFFLSSKIPYKHLKVQFGTVTSNYNLQLLK